MTLGEWQELYKRVHDAADRIRRMKWERINAECLANGLDIACLHNASIDDNLTGWCYRNPDRLRAAKRLNRQIMDSTESRLAERITGRAWATVDR